MNERHQILQDKMFWAELEHGAGGWLDQNLRRGLWLDCLAPEHVRDTRNGLEIAGSVMLDYGDGTRDPYRFVVSIPQKMLHRRRQGFSIEQLFVDEARRTLEIRIASEKKGLPTIPPQ